MHYTTSLRGCVHFRLLPVKAYTKCQCFLQSTRQCQCFLQSKTIAIRQASHPFLSGTFRCFLLKRPNCQSRKKNRYNKVLYVSTYKQQHTIITLKTVCGGLVVCDNTHQASSHHTIEIWLILPVVICLFQGLSHACLRITALQESAHGSLHQT